MKRARPQAHPSRKAAPAVNPPETRNKILEAATALFVVNGAAGTTIRQIADAAGVNSQLIYYYFHDKHGLFRAALEAAAGHVNALLAQATGIDGSPRERLARFISEWVKVTLAEAQTIRMLHRAMLEGDETLAEEIRRHAGGHATQIGSLIAEGVANGAFRADLDPRRAVASLVGMVQYLALAGPILFASAKLEPGREGLEAMAQHTADLFLRGVVGTRRMKPRAKLIDRR
jgi:TetR/AcrR family transcriptional regulator